MCTLALATLLVAVDARADSLFLAIIGGAIRHALWTASRSWILNPLSAITQSPGWSNSKKPLARTISLSLIQPVYNFDKKLKWQIGESETTNLNVLW
jgi:hypothetical protein